MGLCSLIGVLEQHPAVLTMLPTAVGIQWGHRGHPSATSLFPILAYAASARAPVRAKGKENNVPVSAVVFLLLINEVEAPRLAAYALFAPSKPVIPNTLSIAQGMIKSKFCLTLTTPGPSP
jgi:hypothetical protein